MTRFEPTVEARDRRAARPRASCSRGSTSWSRPAPPPARSASTATSSWSGRARCRARAPPYRPLTEVVADQHVFELAEVAGTMLGFRFPAYVEGIEVAGYHLHFIDEDRRRGGHVLDSRSRRAARPDRPLRRPPRRAAAGGRPRRPRPLRRDPRRDRRRRGRLSRRSVSAGLSSGGRPPRSSLSATSWKPGGTLEVEVGSGRWGRG